MTIGRDHALASIGKIWSSAKLPCCYIKRPPDQINPELVANVFKKYHILDSMNGTEDDISKKKNLKIVKTLKVKNRLKMVKRMTETLECSIWEEYRLTSGKLLVKIFYISYMYGIRTFLCIKLI